MGELSTTTPLSGVTVVSLEHAIAAPLCTRQLAELGARVIKIERVGSGDFARYYDERVKGLSSHFVWTNRSKESLSLNLKDEQALKVLHQLLSGADVLVQNLAPGATAKMGFGYEQLKDSYPQLIVCDISGYGAKGPFKDKKAYDLLVQAEAGFLTVTGTADEMVKSGISIADISAGMQAQTAILAALLQRGKTGVGSHVEISMLETMVEWMGFPLYYAYEGATPPARSGADHASIYPYGVFKAGDGKTVLIGLQNEREWQSFCAVVLENSDLGKHPDFHNNSLRSANREALRGLVNSAFAELGIEDVRDRLDRANIAYAGVNDMADVWQHPQLAALNRIRQVDTPEGAIDTFLPPGNNNSFEATISAVPAVGEHSESILRELGYSPEQIQALRDASAI